MYRWSIIILTTVLVAALGYWLGSLVPQTGMGWKTAACVGLLVAWVKTLDMAR